MHYRLKRLSATETDQLLDEIEASFDHYGFGMWAVQRIDDQRLIRSVGMEVACDESLFAPAHHIGWTLARDAWGYGYATEGATAVLDHVFEVVGLPEVVAHTTSANERSRAVMRRLAMTHNPADDVDGPRYPLGHQYRRLVLNRMTASEWGVPREEVEHTTAVMSVTP